MTENEFNNSPELPDTEPQTENIAEAAENEEEFSTIFSAPAEKTEKIKKRRPVRMIVSLLLTLFLVVGVAVAAIKLIPKPDEDEDESLEFKVVAVTDTDVESIELKNDNDEMVFLCTKESDEANEDLTASYRAFWSIKDIAERLTDTTTISNTTYYCTNLYAIKEFESGKDEDYGFDKPVAVFTVKARDNAFEDYTVTVGKQSFDKSGNYVKVSGIDKVYLVDGRYTDEFVKVRTDFATTKACEAIQKTTLTEDYFEEDTLATCDKITLSGRKFQPALVFEPNDSEGTKTYSSFLITSPVRRFATDTSVLLNLAANGLMGNGAYVFNPTDADIEAYGLNDPLGKVTIEVAGMVYEYWIAESPVEEDKDDYYCLIDSNREAIFRVVNTSLSFMDSSATDFYNSFLTMEMLNELSTFRVTTNNTTYSFLIDYDKDAAEGKEFTITLGTDGITASYFQNFYAYFLGLEAVEYNTVDVSAMQPTYSVVMMHTDTSVKNTTMDIYKITDQRYQVQVDGYDMGLITASSYKKLVKYTEAIVKNTDLE